MKGGHKYMEIINDISNTLNTELNIMEKTIYKNELIEIIGQPLEVAIVILGGTCTIEIKDRNVFWEHLGKRKNVFDGPATTVYIPPFLDFTIKSEVGEVQVAIISAPSDNKFHPYVVTPEEVQIEYRGQKEWRREVHNILRENHTSSSLRLGETYSNEGVWSGYPPHKHDTDNLPYESKQIEQYLVRIEPSTGFGILVNYKNLDEKKQALVVHDKDIISIKEGYHTIVAAAGHKFYYLWVLSGENRVLVGNVDENYSWLTE